MSPGHRRDLLLDSGAVSALARDTELLNEYLVLIRVDYEGSIWIPNVVMSEVRTGDPRHDVVVDRLINVITRAGGGYLQVTDQMANRAGLLRTELLRAHRAKALKGQPEPDISGIDGLIVGVAEERSRSRAVTILTCDPGDSNCWSIAPAGRTWPWTESADAAHVHGAKDTITVVVLDPGAIGHCDIMAGGRLLDRARYTRTHGIAVHLITHIWGEDCSNSFWAL